jgi:two-component system, LytTR family, sensor kinase
MKWAVKHIANRQLMLHTGFWLAWIVSFTLLQSLGQGREWFYMWFRYYLITLPVFMAHTYLLVYWLVPLTFFKQRFLLLAFGVVVFLFVFSALELFVASQLVFNRFNLIHSPVENYLNFKNILISGIGNHYIILVFLAIKVGRDWQKAQNMKIAEQQWNEETKLEIWHYQFQPGIMLHLMEVLDFTNRTTPQKSPELIIQISNFLNNFLKKNYEVWTPLASEAELIENYLGIYVFALEQRIKKSITKAGNLNSFVVPPLLLLPAINFVLKSGMKCNDTIECTVFIEAENKKMYFLLEFWTEKLLPVNGNNPALMMQKRLQQSFPGKFKLREESEENFWMLELEIFH